MVPVDDAARVGATHRADKQDAHSVSTTVRVKFLSEKCRGSTSEPMDDFFSNAILAGLRSRAAMAREGGGENETEPIPGQAKVVTYRITHALTSSLLARSPVGFLPRHADPTSSASASGRAMSPGAPS